MQEPHFYRISAAINRSVWCRRGPKKTHTIKRTMVSNISVKVKEGKFCGNVS